MTIRVFYSCALCGLIKVGLDVPAREVEDVRVWMDSTILLLSQDHNRLSPHCHPTTLTNLLIPMTGVDRIGGPAVS